MPHCWCLCPIPCEDPACLTRCLYVCPQRRSGATAVSVCLTRCLYVCPQRRSGAAAVCQSVSPDVCLSVPSGDPVLLLSVCLTRCLSVLSGDPVLLQSAGVSDHRLHVSVDGGLLFLRDRGDRPACPHAARLSRAALQVRWLSLSGYLHLTRLDFIGVTCPGCGMAVAVGTGRIRVQQRPPPDPLLCCCQSPQQHTVPLCPFTTGSTCPSRGSTKPSPPVSPTVLLSTVRHG